MNLAELQNEIGARWGAASYKSGIIKRDHAVLHLMKALGKIAAATEQDHHLGGEKIDVRKQIADLVICSSRLASLLGLDLGEVVEMRLEEKFPLRRDKS